MKEILKYKNKHFISLFTNINIIIHYIEFTNKHYEQSKKRGCRKSSL
jgi:hypothetical protein